MTITYRSVKGSPLTTTELDNNFHDLDDRLVDIETDSSLRGESIDTITLVDDIELNILGDKGTNYGNFAMPRFTPQGNWATATDYAIADTVVYDTDGNGYACNEAHTSGTFATDLAAGKWVKIVDSGDNADPISWQGDWSSLTAYSQGDGVTYNGKLYAALQAGTNQQPDTTEGTYWDAIGIDGDPVTREEVEQMIFELME